MWTAHEARYVEEEGDIFLVVERVVKIKDPSPFTSDGSLVESARRTVRKVPLASIPKELRGWPFAAADSEDGVTSGGFRG